MIPRVQQVIWRNLVSSTAATYAYFSFESVDFCWFWNDRCFLFIYIYGIILLYRYAKQMTFLKLICVFWPVESTSYVLPAGFMNLASRNGHRISILHVKIHELKKSVFGSSYVKKYSFFDFLHKWHSKRSLKTSVIGHCIIYHLCRNVRALHKSWQVKSACAWWPPLCLLRSFGDRWENCVCRGCLLQLWILEFMAQEKEIFVFLIKLTYLRV